MTVLLMCLMCDGVACSRNSIGRGWLGDCMLQCLLCVDCQCCRSVSTRTVLALEQDTDGSVADLRGRT